MPDLSSHYAAAYWNADLFERECITRNRDPYNDGIVATIVGGDFQELFNPGSRKREERFILYFRELDKGLPLTKPHFNVLCGMYGPDSDAWKGRAVRLVLVGGEGRSGGNAIRIRRERFSGEDDPIGQERARQVQARFRELGLTTGEFIRWMADHHAGDIKDLDSMELHDWPVLALRRMREWIEARDQGDASTPQTPAQTTPAAQQPTATTTPAKPASRPPAKPPTTGPQADLGLGPPTDLDPDIPF